MELSNLQTAMRAIYGERDSSRGVDATFRWFTEEVVEPPEPIRTGDRANLELEFSDVAAWLASLANLLEVDLDEAVARYAMGCPKCHRQPCACPL